MLAKTEKWLFWGFASLFIIALFNRELTPFGVDLRFIVLAIGGALGVANVVNLFGDKKSWRQAISGADKLVLAFMIVSLLVNVAWLWNGLSMHQQPFMAVLSACAYHLIVYLLMVINRRYISWRAISCLLLVSGLILLISMLISYAGLDLKMFGSSYPGGYIDRLSSSLISPMRYGGYAQDPNYASLFMVIWAATAVYSYVKTRHIWQLLVVPLALFGLLLSASKAILLVLPLAALMAFVRPNKVSASLKYGLLVGGFLLTIVAALLNLRVDGVQTLNTRISLWHAATPALEASPIIGNGLTAARSAAAETKWYVQSHSSVIQILLDMGILGLSLIGLSLRRNLFSPHKLTVFLTVVFMAHFLSHETIYQSYFLFIIGLLPLYMRQADEQSDRPTADIYVINTLSNGGAERVVQNMANNSTSDKVFVFTLYQSEVPAYKLNDNIQVINLRGKNKRWCAPVLAGRLSVKLDEIYRDYEVRLASAHLPFAQLVVRLTKHTSRFLYVMHGMYGVRSGGLSGLIVKWLYHKQALVSVSKGLIKGDLIDKYGISARYIKAIYNPVDFSHIDKKLTKQQTRKKQILYVGRLAPPKNPLAAVRAFMASGLASSNYKLVMLGDGELRPDLEEFIARHDLNDQVIIEGFVDNPFRYMQESAMLLIASDYEAFTMVAIEAFYCECPVVAYNINYGINEVLTGDLAAFIAPVGDEQAMGRIIHEASRRYPGGLRKRVEAMVAPDIIMQQYYDTYREWMA